LPSHILEHRPDLMQLLGGSNVQPPTTDLGGGQFVPTPPEVQARMHQRREATGGGQLPARDLALDLLRALMQLMMGGQIGEEGELPPIPPFDPQSFPIEELPPTVPPREFETGIPQGLPQAAMSPQDMMMQRMMQQAG
jgi:hypothetical protein